METSGEVRLRGFHHEGYNYNAKNKEKTRYGCIKVDCRAKLYISSNQDRNTIEILEPHTCLKSSHEDLNKKILRAKLKRNAAAPFSSTPKEIFNETSLENKSIASTTVYPNVLRTIQRAKATNNAGIKKQYGSIQAFAQHVHQYPCLLQRNNNGCVEKISAHLLQSSSQSFQLILYDENLMKKLDGENDVYVDATFKVCPNIKGAYQLLTIMAKKCNIAIVRKARSKDYNLYLKKDNANKNPLGQEVIKKLLVLPLLPADKIGNGVEIIKNLIDIKFKNNSKDLKKWFKFINVYFEKEWIQKIGASVFSVFNNVDRTNNFLESYHRTLNQHLRTKPSTNTFIYTIFKIKEHVLIDLERAKNQLQVTEQPKRSTFLRDKIIRSAWLEMMATPPWSVEKFINELSGYENESTMEVIEKECDRIDEVIDDNCDPIDDSDDEDEDMDFNKFSFSLENDKTAETSAATDVSASIASTSTDVSASIASTSTDVFASIASTSTEVYSSHAKSAPEVSTSLHTATEDDPVLEATIVKNAGLKGQKSVIKKAKLEKKVTQEKTRRKIKKKIDPDFNYF